MAVYRTGRDVELAMNQPVLPAAVKHEEAPLRFSERFIAAAGASIVAATVVNPLDVVKTRMQAQAAARSAASVDASRSLYEVSRQLSRHIHPSEVASSELELALHSMGSGSAAMGNSTYRWSDRRFGITHCPPQCVRPTRTAVTSHAPNCTTYTSIGDAFGKIWRQEGITALWRGTSTSLLMSVPMVGIYMPLYDYCMASWSKAGGAYTPILAGTFSRVVAVFSVAPFELIRTRQQVAHFTGSATGKLSVLEAAKLHSTAVHSDSSSKARMMLRQVRSLWTGVSATLLRDVPFSALYWGTVEPTRQALLPKGPGPVSKKDLVVSNMVAGGVCGCFAAGITTPFDVVKTRLQLGAGGPGKKANVWQVLRDIRQQQGLQGLFSGVGPRSVRAAPACALVISVYEVLKSVQLSMR